MSNQAYNEIYGSRAEGAAMGASEPSQESMLDLMRGRLTSLSDEARSIRAQVPHEFEPDVERIQQQMLRLGERLSDLSRGALVPYGAAQRVQQERRVKVVSYVTEDDMRVARVRPDQIIPLAGPAGLARNNTAQEPNPWDEAAATALVELYESGEAFAASMHREAVAAGSSRANMQIANRSMHKPVYASGANAMSGASQGGSYGGTMDSSVLDQRFAEIAARIEQSLSQIRPEAALASLGNRFDQLETQINTMFGQMATRADLEDLRIAEGQIEEIATQLNHFRRQMARLDMIDAHLGTLTSQLSDDRLTRLFSEGVQVSADVGRLDAIDAQLRMVAVQLSDERLSGLVSRSAARGVDYDEVADAAMKRVASSLAEIQSRGSQGREIGEVRGMLENLINERRHNDENNASMLETMQQAIIRVLDRIDSLELAQQQIVAPAAYRAPAAAPAPAYAPAPAPATPAAAAYPSYDDLIPPTATVFAEMPHIADEDEPSDFLPVDGGENATDMDAYREDVAAELAPPRIPVYTTSSFDLDAAFSRSRDAEAESFGESQTPKPSMETLRHDFIADAHRAKLKAASKPDFMGSDLRAGELITGSREVPPKAKRRSIFSFRSQRVAMSLLVLLAAIPAAIFFMPRTTSARMDAIPTAATVAPAPKRAEQLPTPPAQIVPMDAEPMEPGNPNAAPPATDGPSRQTNQGVLPLERQGSRQYEDVNASGSSIDTASLPNGIMMQPANANGQQLASLNEQARMAYMSSQVGVAAARATPASLMEERVLRQNGAGEDASATGGAPKLPPATVGPFSMRLAAAQGDASAQFEVASRLAEGKGLDQDLTEAAQWYQRAAANGFPMAQFRLGTLYERGLGVKPDPQRAQIWYERAAAQGNVKAMHNLAVLIASQPKGDFKAAANWFTTAAEHGLSDSQFNLAVLYENGMGVKKDPKQAYKWLILAAKSGDKDAAVRRDAVKAKLNAEELAVAETEASTWQSKPITGMANDARLAGQAWRDANRRG
jgi:localization factor PodJL